MQRATQIELCSSPYVSWLYEQMTEECHLLRLPKTLVLVTDGLGKTADSVLASESVTRLGRTKRRLWWWISRVQKDE